MKSVLCGRNESALIRAINVSFSLRSLWQKRFFALPRTESVLMCVSPCLTPYKSVFESVLVRVFASCVPKI